MHYIAEVTCKMLVLVKSIYSIVKVKMKEKTVGWQETKIVTTIGKG